MNRKQRGGLGARSKQKKKKKKKKKNRIFPPPEGGENGSKKRVDRNHLSLERQTEETKTRAPEILSRAVYFRVFGSGRRRSEKRKKHNLEKCGGRGIDY